MNGYQVILWPSRSIQWAVNNNCPSLIWRQGMSFYLISQNTPEYHKTPSKNRILLLLWCTQRNLKTRITRQSSAYRWHLSTPVCGILCTTDHEYSRIIASHQESIPSYVTIPWSNVNRSTRSTGSFLPIIISRLIPMIWRMCGCGCSISSVMEIFKTIFIRSINWVRNPEILLSLVKHLISHHPLLNHPYSINI